MPSAAGRTQVAAKGLAVILMSFVSSSASGGRKVRSGVVLISRAADTPDQDTEDQGSIRIIGNFMPYKSKPRTG